jgi:PKD repeat protein
MLASLTVVLSGAVPAGATTGDVGYQDSAYTGTAPTADKPQSKLWFNDGRWWADMFEPVSKTWHIWRLNRSTEIWSDTGTKIDDRAATHGDALWDGTHLYVASNVVANDSASNVLGQPARLYRYSYDATAGTYSLDNGFPANINNVSSESLTLDKDSRGVLWATWTQANQVYVNATNGTDASWGTPFVVGVPGASTLKSDDISALAAYGKTKVGLMWSNQTDSNVYFAVHKDGDAPTTWTSQVALGGPGFADDHLNLKQLEGDDLGHLYAAVKTSLDDISTDKTLPQVEILALNPNSGTWDAAPFDAISDCHTRPQIVIDSANRVLHVFATAPYTGCAFSGAAGTIFEKTSSLNSLSFAPGRGTPVIRDAASDNLNNVTTTKQNVTPSTGLIVLASNDVTKRYWHGDIPLTGTAPNVSFTATPTSGTAPLAVQFTDTSTGGVTAWSWTFGDGGTSTAQNPSHTYTTPGTYSVSLTVSNSSGTDTATQSNYITVTPPPPDFTLSASPANVAVVRGNTAKYTISITPTNGFTGPVSLSVSGLPANSTATFTQNPVDVPSSLSSTLSVATTSTTKTGGATLTISGISGSLTHSVTVSLQVRKK